MIRDLRKADAPTLFEFLQIGFPEEEALLGATPDGYTRVVRRILRWDTRFVLGLLRVAGRPIFRYLVVEEDHRVVATTLLTFPERTGFVSNVMVHPDYRHRGHARALLERARELAARAGKKYIALEVLRSNTPAITLYERLGYRHLDDGGALVSRESTTPIMGPTSGAVRPFVPKDARPLAEVSRRALSSEVLEVLPPSESGIRGSTFVDRALESTTRAWVVDRGRGPEAHVAANVGGAMAAAHISEPIVAEGLPEPDVAALVRTAVEWCARANPPRIVGRVAAANGRARSALFGGGFREVIADWTLYRSTN